MTKQNAIQRTSPQSVEVRERQSGRTPQNAWTYRPHVDIFETSDGYVLLADMPGATSDGIDVSFEAGVLTIESQVEPRKHGAGGSALQEYGVGNFHRRFEIDGSIDAEHVDAELKDGVLTIQLPKASQARRHRVSVRSSSPTTN